MSKQERIESLEKMPDTIYDGAIIKCQGALYVVDEASIESKWFDDHRMRIEMLIECHGLTEAEI